MVEKSLQEISEEIKVSIDKKGNEIMKCINNAQATLRLIKETPAEAKVSELVNFINGLEANIMEIHKINGYPFRK